MQGDNSAQNSLIYQQNIRIEFMEKRIENLEQTLARMRDFLSKIEEQ